MFMRGGSRLIVPGSHIKCNIITDVFPDKPPCVQRRLPLPIHDTYPLELPTELCEISQCPKKCLNNRFLGVKALVGAFIKVKAIGS